MPLPNDPLITDDELAAEIGRPTNWLAKLRMTGEGPRFLKIGGTVRYRRSAIDDWLQRCERASTSSNRGRAA